MVTQEVTDQVQALRDIFGNEPKSELESNGARIQGRDWGEQIPSDLNDVKPVPKFHSIPLGPIAEPQYNIVFGTYTYPEPEVEESTGAATSYMPGKVVSFVSREGTGYGTSPAVYLVDVYKNGLSGDPETVQATQLQLANWEDIPANTWVMVGLSQWTENGTNYEEYTMQVPVWL
jgi:hypothetical protein